jgi:hypothetical protein
MSTNWIPKFSARPCTPEELNDPRWKNPACDKPGHQNIIIWNHAAGAPRDLGYATKICKGCRNERARSKKSRPASSNADDYASVDKERQRLILADLCRRNQGGPVLCMPGPRMIEPEHYVYGAGVPWTDVIAVEREPSLAASLTRAFVPLGMRVINKSLSEALIELSDAGLKVNFAHFDTMGLCTNPETLLSVRRLVKWRVLLPGGILVVNMVNGHDQVNDRPGEIEKILTAEGAQFQRIGHHTYGQMIWAAWRVGENQ